MTPVLIAELSAYVVGGYLFIMGALEGVKTEGSLSSRATVRLFMGTVLILAAFS